MAYHCRDPDGARDLQQARHYYGGDGNWYTKSGLESRYSDFVPYDYDDRTLLKRILQAFNYARSSLWRTSGRSILCSTISSTNSSKGSGSGSQNSTLVGSKTAIGLDIEMISSSPSPTLHGSNPSHSPSSYHGSYRSSHYASSPRPFIKPPPAALRAPTSTPAHKPRLSQQWASPQKVSKDAGTQCTPVPTPSDSAPSKKRGTPSSPKPSTPPPEPSLRPHTASNPPITAPTSMPTTTDDPVTKPKPTQSSSSSSSSASASTRSHSSSPKRARPARPPVKVMPLAYETCDTSDLVHLISSMLLELISHNDLIPLADGLLTRFHSRAPPGISVKDYLQRLTTHATLSPPILLSMVYYIDRLCSLYPAFTISSLTVHRFLITAATVASKGLSDSFWTNNTYARVGGVSLKELALLELEFLWRVEWRIVPKPEDLTDYYRSLVERSEGYRIEGSRGRGVRSSSKGSQGSQGSQASGSGGKEKASEKTKTVPA